MLAMETLGPEALAEVTSRSRANWKRMTLAEREDTTLSQLAMKMRSWKSARPLVGDGTVIRGRGGGVAVGLLVVLEVELRADVVAGVGLPVEAGEVDVLLQVTGGGGLLAGEEGFDRVALGGGDGGGADVAQHRGDGGGRRVEQGVDLAEAVVGEEVEELILDNRSADGAAELLLLVDGGVRRKGLPPTWRP